MDEFKDGMDMMRWDGDRMGLSMGDLEVGGEGNICILQKKIVRLRDYFFYFSY
jgi:hypothetical protein